ncbi:MAG TPA: S41 family peptidase [Candidatus Sulfomarinibacteraceae bacterium]|nr:S41 family peptidase [Candidatus Sulfomarinibacteraceae bacterium]
MRRDLYFIILTILALVAVACGGEEPVQETQAPPAAPTDTPPAQPTAVTEASGEASPTATPELATPEEILPEDTAAEDEAEATATLSPIRATQQALADAVTMPTAAATRPRIAPDDYPALVAQACEIVQENYVRDDFNGVDWQAKCDEYEALAAEIEDQEAYWNMMEAFIGELNDDHSRYVRPDRFSAEFRLPSEGGGQPWPGLILFSPAEDERLLIWHVCEVGAAARAGLRRGDLVVAIDGDPAPSNPEREGIYEALYAEGQDRVTLTVQQGPDAQPRDFDLAYGGASGCDGWQVGVLSQSPYIGYIRVPSFGGDSDSNILTAIGMLEEEQPLDGLVVDVRHNPGGNSDRDIAIFTEGEFGRTGPLRADATQSVYRIRGPVKWNETTPVAVLTDSASRSAPEYFATAMQQSGRATLVGMPTAGNTEGITGFNLADGSLIRLAVMTLQLPDGNTLEDVGVQPDVRVPLGEWGLRQRPDVQVQTAVELLLEAAQ